MSTADMDDLLAERKRRYGEFRTHAEISQTLKCVMRAHEGWDRLADDQKEALEMVAHKIGRILNGDPNYDDVGRHRRLCAACRRAVEGGAMTTAPLDPKCPGQSDHASRMG